MASGGRSPTGVLRVGFAGLGRIFSLHTRGYGPDSGATICALFDPDLQSCAREAERLPGVTICDSFEALLDQDLDLVEVLSPHPYHAEQAIAALRRGIHVSVQKPMAMTVAEADAMIAAARGSGRLLRVFENFRFIPALVKAKALIDDGAIGRPLHCRMRTLAGDPSRAWPVRGDTWKWRAALFEKQHFGRLTFDDGHHKMATALWFFGPVRDVFARIESTPTPFGAIDAPASIQWRHVDPPVHLIWDVIHAPKMQVRTDYYSLDECFEVTGETGILKVTRATGRMLDEPVLTLYRDGEVRAFHNIDDDWGDSFAASTRAMIAAIREGGEAPLSGEQGREVLRLGLAVSRSSQSGLPVTVSESGPHTNSAGVP